MKSPTSRPASGRASGRALSPKRPHRPPPRRKSIVVQICLYPDDLEKLEKLARGGARMKSVVVRHLIRTCEEISKIDLQDTMRKDGLIQAFTKAQPTYGQTDIIPGGEL